MEPELFFDEGFEAKAFGGLIVEHGFAVCTASDLLDLVARKVVGDNHYDVEFTETVGVVLGHRLCAEVKPAVGNVPALIEPFLDVKLSSEARTEQTLDIFRPDDQKSHEWHSQFLFSLLRFDIVSAQKNNSEIRS